MYIYNRKIQLKFYDRTPVYWISKTQSSIKPPLKSRKLIGILWCI